MDRPSGPRAADDAAKPRPSKTTARVITWGLGTVALVLAALVFMLVSLAIYPTKTPSFLLTSDTGLSVTGSISSSPTRLVAAPFCPGARRYLWYSAHNPLKVPITVTTMSVATVTAPAGCTASGLDLSATRFSGSLVVPPSGSRTVAVPISMEKRASCANATFSFSFAGTANYIEVYATTTTVRASQNQATVTYTATVTARPSARQDPVPSSPTGTVSFMEGGSAVCTVALIANATAASTATCGPITDGSRGVRPVTAVYTNADGNFTNSTGTGS